jgi:hypothetical protein
MPLKPPRQKQKQNCKNLVNNNLLKSSFTGAFFIKKYLGVAPLLLAAPGFTLQLRLAAKAGQSGVFVTIPNALAAFNFVVVFIF